MIHALTGMNSHKAGAIYLWEDGGEETLYRIVQGSSIERCVRILVQREVEIASISEIDRVTPEALANFSEIL